MISFGYRMDHAQCCRFPFVLAQRFAKNPITAARAEGVKVGMIRPITLLPFPKKQIAEAAKKVKAFI